MFARLLSLVTLSLILHASSVFALPIIEEAFVAKYPATANTKLSSCATCHMPVKADFLNSYGLALRDAKLNFAAVEALPSVVADKTNLDRIKDLQFPGSFADNPDVFQFPTMLGVITFNHGAHIINPDYTISGNCAACHADGPNFFPKAFNPTIVMKTQGHNTCLACHQASGVAAAPTKCMDCHKKDSL